MTSEAVNEQNPQPPVPVCIRLESPKDYVDGVELVAGLKERVNQKEMPVSAGNLADLEAQLAAYYDINKEAIDQYLFETSEKLLVGGPNAVAP
jgi:hypothetical protein